MEIPKSSPASTFRPRFDGKIDLRKFEPTGDLDLNNCYSQSTITMDINTGGAMRINKLITVLLIIGTSPSLSAAPPDSDVTYSDIDCGKGLECLDREILFYHGGSDRWVHESGAKYDIRA